MIQRGVIYDVVYVHVFTAQTMSRSLCNRVIFLPNDKSHAPNN